MKQKRERQRPARKRGHRRGRRAVTGSDPERINPYRQFIGSFVPNWLLCRTEISHGAKLTYARLCQYAGKTGDCFPCQNTLAREVGVRGRTIRDYLAELEDQRLIERQHRGRNRSDAYYFLRHSWMTNGAGNPAAPERQGPATPEWKNPATPEWQSSAYIRESFEENQREENHLKKNEQTVGPLVGTSKQIQRIKQVGEEQTVEDPSETLDDGDGGEAAAADQETDGGSKNPGRCAPPTGEVPRLTAREWLEAVIEPDGFVELHHRYLRHRHPGIRIRSRLQFDLENAHACLENLQQHYDEEEVPGEAIRWILWYVDTRVDPDDSRTTTITALKGTWWDHLRLPPYRDWTHWAGFFAPPRDPGADGTGDAAADPPAAPVTDPDMVPSPPADDPTGARPCLEDDSEPEPPRPWATVDEVWARYVELMQAAFPEWHTLRGMSRSDDFRRFRDELDRQAGDRWGLLADFVEWKKSDWDGDPRHLPSSNGQYATTYLGRFLKSRDPLQHQPQVQA